MYLRVHIKLFQSSAAVCWLLQLQGFFGWREFSSYDTKTRKRNRASNKLSGRSFWPYKGVERLNTLCFLVPLDIKDSNVEFHEVCGGFLGDIFFTPISFQESRVTLRETNWQWQIHHFHVCMYRFKIHRCISCWTWGISSHVQESRKIDAHASPRVGVTKVDLDSRFASIRTQECRKPHVKLTTNNQPLLGRSPIIEPMIVASVTGKFLI